MGRFNVGDLVRVREWDDMKKEFGSYGDFRINCHCSFMDTMKDTCGDVCTIKDLTDSGNYKLSGENEVGWIYSDDMLYPAITYREYAEKVSPKRIMSFHYGGVEGCPFSLPGMCQSKPGFCEALHYTDEVCGRCWDRYLTEKEYKEYEKRKKEEKKEMEFKAGDYVKVFQKASENGANWVLDMDWTVGKVFRVSHTCTDDTCQLEGVGRFWFPFVALRKATPKDILTPFCTAKTRNGNVYLFDGRRLLRERGHLDIDTHDEYLNAGFSSDYDVIDVCKPSGENANILSILTVRGECIWKREEVVEITAEEAARKLKDQYGGAEVKIVV